ncbi:unnamed protein product [Cochlearia groenlandica]
MSHAMKLLVPQARLAFNIARYSETLITPHQNNVSHPRITTALDHKTPIIVQMLDQWREHGNQKNSSDMRCIIKNLKDSDRLSHTLQVSGMAGPENLERSSWKASPRPIRTTLPNTRSDKTPQKAAATFEKMRELGFLLKPSPYNLMPSLYRKLGNQDMVNGLLSEMEENNVESDNLTANNPPLCPVNIDEYIIEV